MTLLELSIRVRNTFNEGSNIVTPHYDQPNNLRKEKKLKTRKRNGSPEPLPDVAGPAPPTETPHLLHLTLT